MWTARQTLLGVVAGPVAVAAAVFAAVAGGAAVGVAVLLVLLVASGCGWLALRGRYRAWAYAERGDDLLVRRGLMVRRLSVVPYGRMQLIEVTAGPGRPRFRRAPGRRPTASGAPRPRLPGGPAAPAQRLGGPRA